MSALPLFACAFLIVPLRADCGSGKIAPALQREFARSSAARSVFVITSSQSALSGITDPRERVRTGTPRAVRAEVTPAQAVKLASRPDVVALVPDEPPPRPPLPGPRFRPELGIPTRSKPFPTTWMAAEVVGAKAAWEMGYTGKGVRVAVIDDRIDFGHPDLQGTQARVENPASPYYGWPIVFDPYSMAAYARLGRGIGGYVNTLGKITESNPYIGSTRLRLPGTSRSGVYRFSTHPSYWLRWMPPANRVCYILVADEAVPGVYDTVYMDLDKDLDFTDEKPCRKGDEIAWHDLNGDGVADLSGGMVYFIADGVNPVPGSDWLYGLGPPAAGTLVCLTGAFDKYESHGTLVASAIAAQGVIGAGQPPYRPGEGGILRGTAPDARLISIGTVYAHGASMYDAVLFAVLGYDGVPDSGDDAHIVNMSFGYSSIEHDGWDHLSRYIAYLNFQRAPHTTFVGAAGNGGPGYGTITTPGSAPTVISVGASTLYGSVPFPDEIESAQQILFGDIQPWSNRGPSALGTFEPDVTAVGAWATGALPLYGDGENAWTLWGGTSLACPMAAGVLAVVFEAHIASHGRVPTFDVARDLLMAGAVDLEYPILEQGAGQVNAGESVRVVTGARPYVFPASWQVRQETPAFCGVIEAGRKTARTFAVSNPAALPVTIDLVPETHRLISSVDLRVRASIDDETPGFAGPDYLIDIGRLIPAGTDLVRARAVIPFEQFSLSGASGPDLTFDNGFALAVYNWTDLNANGVLWRDEILSNGVVNEGELDQREINRFSYDAPAGNCMEVSVADPLNRSTDGLWLGLTHYRKNDSIPVTDVQVTLEFYRKDRWPMVEVRPQRLTVGPGRKAVFRAQFACGPDTVPGVYAGSIRVSADGQSIQTVPVAACVTARPDGRLPGVLSVLGSDRTNSIYDNGLMRGAFDWTWRAESGDWRVYFYVPPAGIPGCTGQASEDGTAAGARLLANVTWQNVPTDIDVSLFGPDPDDFYSHRWPQLFGAYGLAPLGGSLSTGLGGPVRPFYTSTGGPSEWVSAPIEQGIHLALMHKVMSAGVRPGEYLTVGVGPVIFEPCELVVTAGVLSTHTVKMTSFVPFREGIEVRAFGFSTPIVLENERITQNAYDTPSSATWVRDIDVTNAGLLEVSTCSTAPIDIDLYVLRDSNRDGVFDWQSELIALSGGEDAAELVSIPMPADGRYRIAVHGYRVHPSPSTFSINIRAIQGSQTAAFVPIGRIRPGQTAAITVECNPASQGEGIVFVGPRGAPSALQVRIVAR